LTENPSLNKARILVDDNFDDRQQENDNLYILEDLGIKSTSAADLKMLRE